MKSEMKCKWSIVPLGVVVLSVLGCNNSPTVPLPPPDVAVISSSEPDEDGVVVVTGGDDAAEPDSIVLLYNDDSKSGVMEPADGNGSFEAAIPAVAGDTLILRYMIDDEISYKKIIKVK